MKKGGDRNEIKISPNEAVEILLLSATNVHNLLEVLYKGVVFNLSETFEEFYRNNFTGVSFSQKMCSDFGLIDSDEIDFLRLIPDSIYDEPDYWNGTWNESFNLKYKSLLSKVKHIYQLHKNKDSDLVDTYRKYQELTNKFIVEYKEVNKQTNEEWIKKAKVLAKEFRENNDDQKITNLISVIKNIKFYIKRDESGRSIPRVLKLEIDSSSVIVKPGMTIPQSLYKFRTERKVSFNTDEERRRFLVTLSNPKSAIGKLKYSRNDIVSMFKKTQSDNKFWLEFNDGLKTEEIQS